MAERLHARLHGVYGVHRRVLDDARDGAGDHVLWCVCVLVVGCFRGLFRGGRTAQKECIAGAQREPFGGRPSRRGQAFLTSATNKTAGGQLARTETNVMPSYEAAAAAGTGAAAAAAGADVDASPPAGGMRAAAPGLLLSCSGGGAGARRGACACCCRCCCASTVAAVAMGAVTSCARPRRTAAPACCSSRILSSVC